MIFEVITKRSNISIQRLVWLQENASKLYKVYSINKRDGSPRQIAQPTKELKAVQRWLVKRFIGKLPISSSATAYKKGANISGNARVHAQTPFTIRIDFSNFFPTFRSSGLRSFLRANRSLIDGFDDRDIEFCVSIFCRNGALTIGAPSSPALSNVMMYWFDVKMESYCRERELLYTRYADDIFISSRKPNMLGHALDAVKRTAVEFPYADLKVNEAKTAFLSRKNRRVITGLVITPDGLVSLGRDRKREIKSLIFKYTIGNIDAASVNRMRGLLAFAFDVEPAFLSTLSKKYSKDVVDRVLHHIDQ